MVVKYMALCSSYPFKGYHEHSIQSQYFIPFIIKLFIASRKYNIIDVQYRNIK